MPLEFYFTGIEELLTHVRYVLLLCAIMLKNKILLVKTGNSFIQRTVTVRVEIPTAKRL